MCRHARSAPGPGILTTTRSTARFRRRRVARGIESASRAQIDADRRQVPLRDGVSSCSFARALSFLSRTTWRLLSPAATVMLMPRARSRFSVPASTRAIALGPTTTAQICSGIALSACRPSTEAELGTASMSPTTTHAGATKVALTRVGRRAVSQGAQLIGDVTRPLEPLQEGNDSSAVPVRPANADPFPASAERGTLEHGRSPSYSLLPETRRSASLPRESGVRAGRPRFQDR